MKMTSYFQNSVMIRRRDIQMEWVQRVLADPLVTEIQPNGRIRHWGFVAEAGKYLRVVTEPDGMTIHNAFFDRGFNRKIREKA